MARAARMVMLTAGLGVIALAVTTHLFSLDLAGLYGWLDRAFGPVFLVTYLALVTLSIGAIIGLANSQEGRIWRETGLQAAGGIATLALTFTLLGISLGIESLSNQALTPDTVQEVIRELTRHFSMAFLTTIVGLPTANFLRAIVAVRWAAIETQPLEETV